MEHLKSHDNTSISVDHRNNKWLARFIIYFVVVILVVGTGFGVYLWQKETTGDERQLLLSEIDRLKEKDSQDVIQEETNKKDVLVAYTSKVGGLTLKLPSEYVVIVNVDGNKGGAPGSTLRVGEIISPGVISDNVYEWVEIEIGYLDETIDQRAKNIADQLAEDGFENIQQADANLKSIPAKLITAKGFSYDAGRRIYVARSGDFIYQLTSKTGHADRDDDMLKAVIEGANIEEKTFD